MEYKKRCVQQKRCISFVSHVTFQRRGHLRFNQPIADVFTQFATDHFLHEVSVRYSDQPNVHPGWIRASDSLEFPSSRTRKGFSCIIDEMQPQLASVRRCCVKPKRGVDQATFFNTKRSGKDEVCFQYETLSIRSDVANWRKVIEKFGVSYLHPSCRELFGLFGNDQESLPSTSRFIDFQSQKTPSYRNVACDMEAMPHVVACNISSIQVKTLRWLWPYRKCLYLLAKV